MRDIQTVDPQHGKVDSLNGCERQDFLRIFSSRATSQYSQRFARVVIAYMHTRTTPATHERITNNTLATRCRNILLTRFDIPPILFRVGCARRTAWDDINNGGHGMITTTRNKARTRNATSKPAVANNCDSKHGKPTSSRHSMLVDVWMVQHNATRDGRTTCESMTEVMAKQMADTLQRAGKQAKAFCRRVRVVIG